MMDNQSMNIQHLRYFLAVVEAGSITAAAETLNISQPSLSRQLRVFEEDLGSPLFERGARSIQLNHRGREVRDEGQLLIKQIDASIRKIRRAVQTEVIRIGYAPSLGGEILQRAMARFSQCHPQVRVEMHDSTGTELHDGLKAEDFDLCISEPNQDQSVTWQQLLERPLVLAILKSHRLLQEKPKRRLVDVEDLRDERFLFFSRMDYPTAWDKTAGYFQQEKVNVKIAGEFDGISSLSLALEAGLGLALVTANTRLPESLTLLKLKPEPKPICVSVGWNAHKSLDPMKQEFVNELIRAARE